MEELAPLVPAVALMGLFVGGIAWSVYLRASTHRVWRQVADRLGLEMQRGGFGSFPRLYGTMRGSSVRAETFTRGTGKSRSRFTRLRVANGALDPSIRLRAEGAWQRLARVFTGDDVHVGDEAFDQAVNVRGPHAVARAILGEACRVQVDHFVHSGEAKIEDCALEVVQRGVVRDPDGLQHRLESMADLAAALVERNQKILPSLIENARRDPVRGVRLESLRTALESWGGTQEVAALVESSLADPDPEVRLLAAQHAVGVRPVLEAMVRDSGAPLHVRAAALERLIATEKAEEIFDVVAFGAGGPLGMAVPAIRCLGRTAHAGALPRLIEVAERAPPDVAAEICKAFAQLADPRAEGVLLGMVQRDDSPAMRAEAARALGVVGSVRAVEALVPLSKGLLQDGHLKDAARDAIRAIQSRLGNVDGGRLSLADPASEDGALSVASEAGALSRVK